MPDIETKTIAIDLSSRAGKKELAKLLSDGWSVASEKHRSALQWGPKKSDLILTREKA